MKVFYTILLCICATTVARSQYSFSGSAVSSVTVSQVMGLTLEQVGSYNIQFSTINQFKNGITSSNVNTFYVKSNVAWNLSVKASTQYFSNQGTFSSSNMPASVLTIVSPNASKTLSTTDQVFNYGTAGAATKTGNTFNMNILASPGFNYGPGTYTLNIVYTLTAQ